MMPTDEFVWLLSQYPDDPIETEKYEIWSCSSAGEILCSTKETAEKIASAYNNYIGRDFAETGYYDPEMDKKSGTTDGRTGWYFIRLKDEAYGRKED